MSWDKPLEVMTSAEVKRWISSALTLDSEVLDAIESTVCTVAIFISYEKTSIFM